MKKSEYSKYDEYLDALRDIEEEKFIPVIDSWEEFTIFLKPFIKKRNIKAIRDITESYLNYSSRDDDERKIKRGFFEFVFKNNFENKSSKEMVALFKEARKDWKGERKERRQQEKELISEVVKPKTKKEKQLSKYMSGTLSPYSYNYLKLKGKRGEGQIKFIKEDLRKEDDEQRKVIVEVKHLSDKSEMLIDFVFDKLAKKNDAILLKEKPKDTDIITYENFEKIMKESEEGQTFYTSIKFTSKEFRKHFDSRMTDKEINQAVEELTDIKIKLQGVKIWYEIDKKTKRKQNIKININARIVSFSIAKETGEVAPRTKDPQHEFMLTIDLGWGLIFNNDIINRRFGCFPNEFYDLSPSTISLGRYLKSWKESILTIRQISQIMGFEETVNIRKRKVDIEQKLNELKKIKIIKKWERVKKKGKEKIGKETSWHIIMK